MVNEHGALLHGVERALGPDRNLPEVVIIADAGEYKVRAVSRSFRRGGFLTLVLLDPFRGLQREMKMASLVSSMF